jgi:hypothetical protein
LDSTLSMAAGQQDRISFLYCLARTFVLGAYWTDFTRRLCRFVFSFLGGLLDDISRYDMFL